MKKFILEYNYIQNYINIQEKIFYILLYYYVKKYQNTNIYQHKM
ncbi:hypothetical protein pb186bvf_001914 [Paramecium bursaria]